MWHDDDFEPQAAPPSRFIVDRTGHKFKDPVPLSPHPISVAKSKKSTMRKSRSSIRKTELDGLSSASSIDSPGLRSRKI